MSASTGCCKNCDGSGNCKSRNISANCKSDGKCFDPESCFAFEFDRGVNMSNSVTEDNAQNEDQEICCCECESIADDVEEGIISALFKLSIAYLAVSAAIALCAYFFFNEKDSTDPIDGRSGLEIKVDALTGCQYLTTPNGGLTPRLDVNGKQICGGAE